MARRKGKAQHLLNMTICKHVADGAQIEHLLPPADADDGIGEALCGAARPIRPRTQSTTPWLAGIAFGGNYSEVPQMTDGAHYCEYDHDLAEPCGKPATIKVIGMWMCAEHYDQHARLMAEMGRTPENTQ